MIGDILGFLAGLPAGALLLLALVHLSSRKCHECGFRYLRNSLDKQVCGTCGHPNKERSYGWRGGA